MRSLLDLSFLCFCFLCFFATAYAADDTDQRIITLAVENDRFASEEDQYYTSGVRLSWFEPEIRINRLATLLGDIIPTMTVDDSTSVFFSAGQNLYTPKNISLESQPRDDRPWAAWLYGSMGLVTVRNKRVDELELSLGVVGPEALGKQTQRFVHKNTKSPDPRGWKNQLKTEPGLMLAWDRRWPEALSWNPQGWWLSLSPSIGASVGNIHTYAQTGLSFRFGPEQAKQEDFPVRVRPSAPGTGYFEKAPNGLSWSLFGGINGRAVGRNIFLDGNSFTNSHSVDKEPFVWDANAGVALTYGQTRLSYTLVHRSREFKTQDDSTVFGAISLSRRF